MSRPVNWPPRPMRRAIARAIRPGPATRRKRKADARILRIMARYGVKAGQ